jgi:ATP-dependent Lon protease
MSGLIALVMSASASDPTSDIGQLKSRGAAARAILRSEARRHNASAADYSAVEGRGGTTEGLLVMTSRKDEFAEIEDKIRRAKLSKEPRETARRELEKLREMSPMSAEATVLHDYLDWLLSIPWNKKTRVNKDLALAQEILDNDHCGLERVKERIVEHLAVQQRAGKPTGPTLCLVGPPGVGKTSLGKSIARATGRNFVRVSLAGVRDEAEIRGHPRTFVGSVPGNVIQSMRKAKSSNPLFLLDGVDKMGADFRGDPSSALLEALDPEQKHAFKDHYIEVDYDLSDVMFIATASTLHIPPPLMECIEIIRIDGYTENEKVEIARKHLIPRVIAEHGLKEEEWAISDEALLLLIRRYTREAGVRSLERELSSLMRKAVKELTLHDKQSVTVDAKAVADYLGVPKLRSVGTPEDGDLRSRAAYRHPHGSVRLSIAR